MEITEKLKAAIASEEYEAAAKHLAVYCADAAPEEAVVLLPALLRTMRAARSHHMRQLELIRAAKQYQAAVRPPMSGLMG